MDPIECPDCSVAMEPVEFQSGAANHEVILDEKRDDLLGKVGMRERLDVDTFRCTRCGLVRFYAFDPAPPPGEAAEARTVGDDGEGPGDASGEWGTDDDGGSSTDDDDDGWGSD